MAVVVSRVRTTRTVDDDLRASLRARNAGTTAPGALSPPSHLGANGRGPDSRPTSDDDYGDDELPRAPSPPAQRRRIARGMIMSFGIVSIVLFDLDRGAAAVGILCCTTIVAWFGNPRLALGQHGHGECAGTMDARGLGCTQAGYIGPRARPACDRPDLRLHLHVVLIAVFGFAMRTAARTGDPHDPAGEADGAQKPTYRETDRARKVAGTIRAKLIDYLPSSYQPSPHPQRRVSCRSSPNAQILRPNQGAGQPGGEEGGVQCQHISPSRRRGGNSGRLLNHLHARIRDEDRRREEERCAALSPAVGRTRSPARHRAPGRDDSTGIVSIAMAGVEPGSGSSCTAGFLVAGPWAAGFLLNPSAGLA